MAFSLINRRNYKTINKEEKNTQIITTLEDKVRYLIDIFMNCCCGIPINNIEEKNDKQPKITKKQRILREIDENFSDNSIENEDWIEIGNTIIY